MYKLYMFSDFAAALANPQAYQAQLERHSEQLAVLEQDFEVEVSNFFKMYSSHDYLPVLYE